MIQTHSSPAGLPQRKQISHLFRGHRWGGAFCFRTLTIIILDVPIFIVFADRKGHRTLTVKHHCCNGKGIILQLRCMAKGCSSFPFSLRMGVGGVGVVGERGHNL